MMKIKISICALIIISILVIAPPAYGLTQPTAGSLAKDVDAYIAEAMQQLPIKGLSVAIVKGNQVLYMQGYGVANTDNDKVTPQTSFMLESVTKTFTALAVRQLANAGKVNLTSPVQAYIPEFRLAEPNASQEITVQQLLDHTSGISKQEGTAPYLNSASTTFAEAIDNLARFKPRYLPGDHFEYSNWNYVLLGEIITRTSGMPYTEYVQTNILNPLGMSHSTFMGELDLPGTARGNLITWGISVPYDERYLPIMSAAGGLKASAEDVSHYLIAYLNRGQYQASNLLLPAGTGWYGAYWSWQAGTPPNNINDSFSGGHNAVNSNITLFSRYNIGVAVLMNTQLAEFLPGPSAYDIAMNLTQMAAGFTYQPISNRVFYLAWVLVDAFLLLSLISIFWQALHMSNWRRDYPAGSRMKRVLFWLSISLDLIICGGILFLPTLASSRWDIMLSHRPDFSLPLLLVGALLGILGMIKVAVGGISLHLLHKDTNFPPNH